MVTCKDYNRGGAPLASHQWEHDGHWQKLLCTECGAGLSEEGLVQLAIDYQAELRTLRADKERLETERNRALEGGQIVARRLDAIARLKRYESIPGPAEAFRDPGPWVRWAELEPLLTPPSIDAAKEK